MESTEMYGVDDYMSDNEHSQVEVPAIIVGSNDEVMPSTDYFKGFSALVL